MKSERQLRQDVEFLAGRLAHRGANTDNERDAAEYLLERFKSYTPHASIEDIYTINSMYIVLASYYGEFLIVCLLALWTSWGALAYGLAVFSLYLAEITGYPMFSRWLPHYESQNVVARFFADEPRQTLFVTAHYDSPKTGPLTELETARRLRVAHLVVVFSMVAIVFSCVVEGFGIQVAPGFSVEIWVRWASAIVLGGAGLFLYRSESRSEHGRGAVNNATGVAVLLYLSDRLERAPLQYTDVVVAATGAKETWCGGMRKLVLDPELERASTYFLNLAHPGAESLHYVTGEGLLHVFPSSREMVRIARELAPQYGATPLVYRHIPTDALIPLTRRFHSLTITGLGVDEWPIYGTANRADKLAEVDFAATLEAADYAVAIIQRLDNEGADVERA